MRETEFLIYLLRWFQAKNWLQLIFSDYKKKLRNKHVTQSGDYFRGVLKLSMYFSGQFLLTHPPQVSLLSHRKDTWGQFSWTGGHGDGQPVILISPDLYILQHILHWHLGSWITSIKFFAYSLTLMESVSCWQSALLPFKLINVPAAFISDESFEDKSILLVCLFEVIAAVCVSFFWNNLNSYLLVSKWV